MNQPSAADFWAESVLSSRGQITLPKELRDALFLRQGDKVQFHIHNGEVTLCTRRGEIEDPVTRWIGALPLEVDAGGGKEWVRKLRGYEDGVLD